VIDTLRGSWDRYLFTPRTQRAAGLCRIATGLVTLYGLLLYLPFVQDYFTDAGFLTAQEHRSAVVRPNPSLFVLTGASPAVVWTAWAAAITLCVLLTLGYRTRLAAIALYVLLITIHDRNVFMTNSGELVTRSLVFWFALMPYGGGGAYSVDTWLRRRADPTAPPLTAWPWAQRMIQIQIVMIYALTVSGKLQAPRWHDGSAMHEILGGVEFFPSGVELLLNWPDLTYALTWLALVSEVIIGPMLLFKRTRLLAFLLGIGLHGWIMIFMRIPVFGLIMLAAYPAFLEEPEVDRLEKRLRGLWRWGRKSGSPRSMTPLMVETSYTPPPD
jgi:hypothetical protein